MKLRRALVKARESKGLSQADLAKRLNVSAGTVGGWESGTHSIRLGRLSAVAKALGIDVSELLA